VFDLNFTALIANIPALLIGFAFHEYAHAFVADALGDPTPRSQGRLTLNPFVHLDFFGTLMALLFRIGWAKPVIINPSYFRIGPMKGRMLVSLAGPLANLTVAFLATLTLIIADIVLRGSEWHITVINVIMAIVIMNISLGLFNLLPIPPLDGFAVLSGFVPGRYYKYLYTIERYGFLILLIVLLTNVLSYVLWPMVNRIINFYFTLALMIVSLVTG